MVCRRSQFPFLVYPVSPQVKGDMKDHSLMKSWRPLSCQYCFWWSISLIQSKAPSYVSKWIRQTFNYCLKFFSNLGFWTNYGLRKPGLESNFKQWFPVLRFGQTVACAKVISNDKLWFVSNSEAAWKLKHMKGGGESRCTQGLHILPNHGAVTPEVSYHFGGLLLLFSLLRWDLHSLWI